MQAVLFQRVNKSEQEYLTIPSTLVPASFAVSSASSAAAAPNFPSSSKEFMSILGLLR